MSFWAAFFLMLATSFDRASVWGADCAQYHVDRQIMKEIQ